MNIQPSKKKRKYLKYLVFIILLFLLFFLINCLFIEKKQKIIPRSWTNTIKPLIIKKKESFSGTIDSWSSTIEEINEEYRDDLEEIVKEEIPDSRLNIAPLDQSLEKFHNWALWIPWYLERENKAPIVVWLRKGNVEKELRMWVRMSPNSTSPDELWITFIEGHSGQNREGTLTYSYFDNLAKDYKLIKNGDYAYIEIKDYIYRYKLFNKEIIIPWWKDFEQSNYNHLILMTCYPRNTTKKRALFHFIFDKRFTIEEFDKLMISNLK